MLFRHCYENSRIFRDAANREFPVTSYIFRDHLTNETLKLCYLALDNIAKNSPLFAIVKDRTDIKEREKEGRYEPLPEVFC